MSRDNSSFKIRDIGPCELDLLTPLHERIRGTADKQRWTWSYLKTPAADAGLFISAAFHDTTPVGQYAVQLHHFNHRGRRIIGAVSVDSLTDPDYRKQGVFTSLAKHVQDRLSKARIPFAMGFPNAHSSHGVLNHLNWVRLRPKIHMAAPIGSVRFHKDFLPPKLQTAGGRLVRAARQAGGLGFRALSWPSLRDLSVKEIHSLDDQVDSLWRRCKESSVLARARDRAYLDWRYFQCPTYAYRFFGVYRKNGDLAGIAVLNEKLERVGRQVDHIMELIVDPGDGRALAKLLMTLQDVQLGDKVGFSQILCPPNRWEIPYLIAAGYMRVPDAFSEYATILAARQLHDGEPRPNELYDSKSWMTSFGDTDYV